MSIAANLNRTRTSVLRFGFGCRNVVAGVMARRDAERGAVMAEYGLLLMVAMIAAFAIVVLFGESVVGLFENAHQDFDDAWDNPSAE